MRIFIFVLLAQLAYTNTPGSIQEKIEELKQKGLWGKQHEQHFLAGKKVAISHQAQSEGFAIFRLKASEKQIWSAISNPLSYPDIFHHIVQATAYQSPKTKKDRLILHIRFVTEKRVAFVPVRKTYSTTYNFPKHMTGYATFETDPTEENDIENKGIWITEKISEDETLVLYYIQFHLKGVDDWLRGYVIKQAIEDSTQELQEYMEKIKPQS